MERKSIIITGPTCSGKTNLSILLAQNLESEIISADSRQIYKWLDIGTAKPSSEELSLVRHHLINSHNPDEEFNAGKFETAALKIMDEISARHKIPIVCGGSGLYIKALIDGITETTLFDESYREKLKEQINIYGKEYVYQQLVVADPVSASKMLPQNWKRVIRALEVLHFTGKPIWQHHNEFNRKINYNFFQFGLEWKRDKLYERINQRVDNMITSGFVEEVMKILALGYTPQLNSLNTVGYKEIISYLNNEITLERAIELIKRNTRHYAKRQMTWFRKDERIIWFPVDEDTDYQSLVEKIISLL